MIPLHIWTYITIMRKLSVVISISILSQTTPKPLKLTKLTAKNTLRQIVNDPGCISTQQTLLDVILIDSDCVKHSGLLDIHLSDHLPVFVVHNKVKTKTSKFEFVDRSYYHKL